MLYNTIILFYQDSLVAKNMSESAFEEQFDNFSKRETKNSTKEM